MSQEDVGDLRERLARIEERQIQLYGMIMTSMSNFGDLANRTRKLEDESHLIKSKLWIIAIVSGAFMGGVWEFIKIKLLNK